MWTPSGPNQTPTQPQKKPDKSKDKPGKRGKPTGKGEPKKKRALWFRIIKWCAIFGFSGLLLAIGTVAFVFWMYARDKNLPDPSSLSDAYAYRQVTVIVDKHDHRIGELFGRTKGGGKDEVERRAFVPMDQIPKHLVDAFTATEDASFFEHEGVDYWGMFRAFWKNLRSGESKEGASTITQQVVKNMLLTSEKTFKRKIQEIILARRLEDVLTKDEILSLYLNQIYFGNKRYGIQEASRFYFGKDVTKLDAGEAAMLAGLPKSPEEYAPNKKNNQAKAKERQIHVLNRMVTLGKLSPVDAQRFIDAPIRVVEDPFPELGTAPEWVRLVRDELVARKCKGKASCPEGEEYLDKLGATVRTTLDPRLQIDAHQALQAGLRGVDERKGYGRPKRTVDGRGKSKKAKPADDELAKIAKLLPKTGPLKGESYEAVVTAVHDDDKELAVDLGHDWQAGIVLDDDRYVPRDDGKPAALSTRFKAGDVVDVIAFAGGDKKGTKHAKRRVAFPKGPEGAVVVIEVKTRKVRALVGGYATRTLGINRATDAHRQPGSSFKPYVFAAGLELGSKKEKDEGGRITFTTASQLMDAPEPRWEERWNAKNYEAGKFEGYVLMRHALAKSMNTVAIRVLERVGTEKIIDLAARVGIESKLPTTMSLALGAGEVTPLEATNAMATFAAGGKAAKPVFIDAVDGKATPPAETTQAIAPEVAYVTVHMMQSVVTSGTGIGAAKLKIPVAGKTGTSNDARDVWFIGLTPDYAIGIWIGHDDPQSMGRETGGGTAVPVFVEIAKAMKLPDRKFQRPPRVVDARIDRASGKRAPEGWPADKTMSEVFVEGTVPTEVASEEDNDVKGEYK